MRPVHWVCVVAFLFGCSRESARRPALFTDVTNESGISFRNDLSFTESFNPYTYRNFFNGAGVAIGDINNDGLLDIYFAGNQTDNKLYLNTGDLKFKDITKEAGVSCTGAWSTGVTFADVNGDGLLDLYVCKSGDPNTPNRSNELFINNGDLTFREESEKYGLKVKGLSVQAAFFDYDKDGDLDCYLLTNSIRSVGNYDLVKDQRLRPDPLGGGNKFFVNDNGKFVDRSQQAGIYYSNIGFGLGITLGDFNDDSWPDIFVSNDFFERDYLYINNRSGGFTESLTDYFESISMGSMGADLADLDGDGTEELFVTEMLPDSLSRKKTKTVYESWDKYQLNVQNGYYHQFPRNVLQKKTAAGNYVEVGRMAGIAASEWSWGALLFDMNNDGRRDIFVANGIYKDLLDRDYLAYTASDENVKKSIRENRGSAITKLIDLMPQSQTSNYAYRNDGDLHFTNVASEWGMDQSMYSCGSAYGDLDNDGDLDLAVNNINAPSIVYRNNSDTTGLGVNFVFTSKSANTAAIGTRVIAYTNGKLFTADNFVARGFESSVQPRAHIGLGKGVKVIDSLIIKWPAGGFTKLFDVATTPIIHVSDSTSQQKGKPTIEVPAGPMFELVTNSAFKHAGSGLIDFNRDRLLPMMYSNETPALIKGDIDKDGRDEIYIGGGKDQPGAMIRYDGSKFKARIPDAMRTYALSEETKGALFDVDGDGDLDLYMATGGRFFPGTSSVLIDKIFLNDGRGNFSVSSKDVPFNAFVSTSVVVPMDFDKDGDIDIFAGERFDPFTYGLGGRGYLFENDGTGNYTDVTTKAAPMLSNIGMITDGVATDIDNDGWTDLVIVGDWMPIVVLKNKNGSFEDISATMGLAGTEGWWHDVEAADLNKDGKIDLVFANQGLNSFFKAGDRMYVNDFDQSGSFEQIFCTNVGGKYYPLNDRDEFVSQMPSMKKSLLYYKDYAGKSIDDLFGPAVLQKGRVFQVNLLSSTMLLSGPQGYRRVDLPAQLQYAPLYAVLLEDMDKDGVVDLVAGGNNYEVKPQFGRYDASFGWFFKGKIEGGDYSLGDEQDLNVKGEIRDIECVDYEGVKFVIFAKYDDELEIYKVR
ncbi:MAG TPA: VCBS repeat-containing protein [Cyclobacteriaceae bacterium]|nr:VCBS repeat-containing protein [Cyclobacteriaceae bacterium]